MRKEISLEERKQLQLDMLKEIDAFCRANSIRYSIAFGTLLGAIRHKGFIPWDDDVDIIMPLEDLLRFKKTFKSDNLKYCDVDTQPYYDLVFSRITHKSTYKLEGKKGIKSYGISIDVYVFINLPENEQFFWRRVYRMQHKREFITKLRSKIIRRCPVSTIPFYTRAIKKLRDFEFSQSLKSNTSKYYVIGGTLADKAKYIFEFNLFDNLVNLSFESYNFMAVARYHDLLTQAYGDYMQLPPEKDRHPYHNATYYWNEND